MVDDQQGMASRTGADPDPGFAWRIEELEAEVLAARQAALVSRDHVVGIEAEIGRQNAEILRLTVELRRAAARAKRLNQRKNAQAKRIAGLVGKLEVARKRNATLTRRVHELEASAARPSFTRRVVRRLRGTGR